MGQSRRIDDDKIHWKRTTQFSVPRVQCPEERSKAKVVENYQYTSALMRDTVDWTCFSHNYFCSSAQYLRNSLRLVSRIANPTMLEQWRPVLVGQSDPLFVPTEFVDEWHLHSSTDDPCARKCYCKSTKNEWKGYHNKIVWLRFVLDAGFLTTVVRPYSTSLSKAHWRILTIHRVSGMSWVHFAKRWKLIWPARLDIEGTPKLGPCWKSQTATYKVNMEWKSELSL